MNEWTKVIFVAIVVVLGLAAWLWWSTVHSTQVIPTAEWHNATSDMISVSTPEPGQIMQKQFHATGAARGSWYFEATFPASVLDKNGTIITQKPAQALSNWMTQDFVPFDVAFDVGNYTGPATVVLQKDNPSGDPSKEASVRIPITIK